LLAASDRHLMGEGLFLKKVFDRLITSTAAIVWRR
jgi:hypothetical protein